NLAGGCGPFGGSFLGASFFGSFGSTFGGGGTMISALMPGWLKSNDSVSSSSVPVSVSSSTVVPALAPHGETESIRGSGRPGCCWAKVGTTASTARTVQRTNRNMDTLSGNSANRSRADEAGENVGAGWEGQRNRNRRHPEGQVWSLVLSPEC